MESNETKTVLLVEDEALIALAGASKIKRFGYEVLTAGSGEEAVEIAAKNEAISLILMDINLGSGIDGTEAARQILKFRQIPIVFLTSHEEQEYVEKVKNITRYGYVIKNSGYFVLQNSIETAFELFEANRKLEQSMRTLHESEERFRTAIEHSNDMIWMLDREGTFTFLNKHALNMSGYLPDDLIGKSFAPLIPAKDLPRIQAVFQAALEGKPQNFKVEYFKKDGSSAILSVNIAPIFTNGEISGNVSFGRDIT